MNSNKLILLLVLLGLATSFVIPEPLYHLFSNQKHPDPVSYIDLNRFEGLWYDIAETPMPYTVGCEKTTATWNFNQKSDVDFKCIRRGKQVDADMKLKVANTKTNSVFEVAPESWPWFLAGDVYIVRLGNDYDYFVQSDAHYKSLVIYSREPHMPEEKYQSIIQDLRKDSHFRVHDLIRVPQ